MFAVAVLEANSVKVAVRVLIMRMETKTGMPSKSPDNPVPTSADNPVKSE